MSEPTIQFIEEGAPPISAGRPYKLRITQHVTELGADLAPLAGGADRQYHHERTVHVHRERFSIDPQEVVAMYPPDGGVGSYDRILPNITFAHQSLPWARSAGVPKTPWLALLVFHDTDPGGVAQVVPAMVGDLRREPFSPGRSLPLRESTRVTAERSNKSVIASYTDAASGWALMPGEEPWHPCSIVDVPIAQFRALAPTGQDLPWLAHASVVSEGANAVHRSAVIANRVPKAGDHTACLVSLEGLAGFLPPSCEWPTGTTHLRLVVLKTWRFRHGDELPGFHRPLSTGPLCIPHTETASASNDDAIVKNALAMGYTAVDHHTRWGDRTVSWYRGPLLPFSAHITLSVPMPPICEDGYLTGSTPLSSADEALRYDPELGMLDASYASAWQLGRLLALRDKTFSYDLYAWKQETRRQVFAAGAAAERAGHTDRLADSARLPAHEPANSAEGAGGLFGLLVGLIKPALDELAAGAAAAEPDAPDPFGNNAPSPPTRRAAPRRFFDSLFNDRDQLKAHVDHAGVKAPPSVVAGLERLRRLEGVPIDYLVPDARMLPTESLRFFQVDLNWVYSLVEGAYSVARVSAHDRLQDAATCPHDTYHQISGFLLRSSLVSEWPGLQVLTEVSDTRARYRTLRCDRIAPDILLCLVEVESHAVISAVTFQVPSERIEFHLPRTAHFRPGVGSLDGSVVDIHALAGDAATAADFAYRLSRPPLETNLAWDDERGVLVLSIDTTDDTDSCEWQFVVDGHPFGPPVACRARTGAVEIPLDADLPPGDVAIRLRAVSSGPNAAPARWVTSTVLHRPAAHPAQPALGYRVAEHAIAAQWPACEAGLRLETQLRYTPAGSAKTYNVGRVIKHPAAAASVPLRAVVHIGDEPVANGQPVGQVQVLFRTPSTGAGTMPGVWAVSEQAFTRLGSPTRGRLQGEGASQLLFFHSWGEERHPGHDTIEVLISNGADRSRPIHTALGSGRRVLFDVPPAHLTTAGHWLHARCVGQDDLFITSAWFSQEL